MHSSGLRHAFACLAVNDIIRLGQKCSIQRAHMLTPPTMALMPSPSMTARPKPKAKAPPAGLDVKEADAMLAVAKRRKHAAYLELLRRGPQRLGILASEACGRWNIETVRFVTQFVRLRSQCAPSAGVAAPVVGSLERGFAKHTCCHAAGAPFVAGAMPGAQQPALADVLHDAAPPTPSHLGL